MRLQYEGGKITDDQHLLVATLLGWIARRYSACQYRTVATAGLFTPRAESIRSVW